MLGRLRCAGPAASTAGTDRDADVCVLRHGNALIGYYRTRSAAGTAAARPGRVATAAASDKGDAGIFHVAGIHDEVTASGGEIDREVAVTVAGPVDSVS